MKKTACAIGLAGAIALAVAAWAQSSVTVFGIMDLALRRVRTT